MRILFSLAFVVAVAEIAHAATIVSPGAGTLNSESAVPLLVPTNGAPSVRYQQVYGASDFSYAGSLEYLITQISFSSGPSSGVIDVVLPNVQIWFSTTPRQVDSLSPVFGDNVGPNNTLVYSGQLHLFLQQPIGDFAFHIPLQQPFLYDWRAGNLLMDVRNYQTVSPLTVPPYLRSFASSDILGDSVSSALALNASSPTATFVTTVGLFTVFTVTGVPEPSSASLFLVGLSALVLLTWGRRARVQGNSGLAETR